MESLTRLKSLFLEGNYLFFIFRRGIFLFLKQALCSSIYAIGMHTSETKEKREGEE